MEANWKVIGVVIVALALTTAVAVGAVQLCTTCGSVTLPDTHTTCDVCIFDTGNATGCIEVFPSGGCSSSCVEVFPGTCTP